MGLPSKPHSPQTKPLQWRVIGGQQLKTLRGELCLVSGSNQPAPFCSNSDWDSIQRPLVPAGTPLPQPLLQFMVHGEGCFIDSRSEGQLTRGGELGWTNVAKSSFAFSLGVPEPGQEQVCLFSRNEGVRPNSCAQGQTLSSHRYVRRSRKWDPHRWQGSGSQTHLPYSPGMCSGSPDLHVGLSV